eukprot:gene16898-19259_t
MKKGGNTSVVDKDNLVKADVTVGYWQSKSAGTKKTPDPKQRTLESAFETQRKLQQSDSSVVTELDTFFRSCEDEIGKMDVEADPYDMHFAANAEFNSTGGNCNQYNTVNIMKDCPTDIRDLVEEWMGNTAKKEGLVGANFTPGYVDHEFMKRSVQRAMSVVKVYSNDGNEDMVGTGTIFTTPSGLYLLTNHHIIENAGQAEFATFVTDYVSPDAITTSYNLDPNHYFWADKDLDYALVAVERNDTLDAREWMNINDIQCELPKKFECVNIIGHPNGQPVTFSIRGLNYMCQPHSGNTIKVCDVSSLIRHGAYTLPGSSGALLFNDKWMPFALHREAGEEKEKNGHMQKFDPTTSSGMSNYHKRRDDEDTKLYQYNVAVLLTFVFEHARTKGGFQG